MFRRVESNLPEDPKFGTTFKKLGYFINKEDKIKKIDHPSDDFQFFITNNERFNEVQREATHGCIRREISTRLTALNLPVLYLPTLSSTVPAPPTPSLQIHTTPLPLLPTKKRIILLIPAPDTDPTILSYRILSKSGGIIAGSALCIINSIHARAAALAQRKGHSVTAEDATPGIILANPGQLLYSHSQRRSMTHTSWLALPRRSAVHPGVRIHETHNRVAGNATAEQHIVFIFEHLLSDPEKCHPEAELYIIALGAGGDLALQFLQKNQQWCERVAAVATTSPVPTLPATCPFALTDANRPFLQFLAQRVRTYTLSPHPLNTPLSNPTPISSMIASAASEASHASQAGQASGDGADNNDYNGPAYDEVALFPIFSAGPEAEHAETVICEVWPRALDWFEGVADVGGAGTAGTRKYVNGWEEVDEGVRVQTLGLEKPKVVEW